MKKQTLKFGCWPSEISAEFVAGKTPCASKPFKHLADRLYWSEVRPSQKGRAALVCASLDASADTPSLIDLLPAPYSARSKVHEYGGGAFLATNELIFFVNADDQQIWSIENKAESEQSAPPQQITNAPEWRFADLCHDPLRHRLICVGEKKPQNGGHPQNLLVSISLNKNHDQQIIPLIEGDDFYASPRLSPDARHLAFVSWNLPADALGKRQTADRRP